MIQTWAPLRLITCHLPARTLTILACQFHPSPRAPFLTTLLPLPRPQRLRSRQTIRLLTREAITFHLPKLLDSFRVGTSRPVATEPPAFLPILRVRIIRALCPRLLSTPLPMTNLLTLLTFIFLHPLPSSNRRMVFPLIIFPLSPHSSQRRSLFHRHLSRSCPSVTARR